MNKLLIIITLGLFSLSANAENIPSILAFGFAAYKSEGPKAALKAWVKDSGLEGSKDAISEANSFQRIEDYYGKYQGYDLFKNNSLGPKTNQYLITINYEKGVLFTKFFTYKSKNGDEVIFDYDFHPKVDQVWPSYMVYSE